MRIPLTFVVTVYISTLPACRHATVQTASSRGGSVMKEQDIERIQSQKIFFGHKSVGDNVLAGIRELMLKDSRLRLNIVRSPNPESISGPALIEHHVGKNGDSKSKNDEFVNILRKGFAAQSGIAILKYCYADVNASTDVPKMFAEYRQHIAELKQEYPLLRIVHTTVPVTTVESAPKAWLKSLIGKRTTRDANVKRHEFNELLRATYRNFDPIFDIAEAESTRPDGTKAYFNHGALRVQMLAPEYTTDGGHLNERGRRVAADRLMQVLAAL